MVSKDQNGVWQPNHPNFASVAADANYNEGVTAARSVAVNQGQLLPEHKQSVQEMVSAQLAQERELMRTQMFFEANEQKLFVMNPDGTRKMEVQGDGKLYPVRSEIGLAAAEVAQELLQSGARFDSQHDLAKYALKIAEGRVKMKQDQQVVNNGGQPPGQAQPMNHDLAALFNSHKQSGNAGGGNINTLPAQQTNDLRTNLRNILKPAGEGLNGMDYANFIRGNR